MNNQQLTKKVQDSVDRQWAERGWAAPVDVLMDIGILTKENYESWRRGAVPYLERVCRTNLHKLSFAMKEMRGYALKNGGRESRSCYRAWGGKKKAGGGNGILRFSKSGAPAAERAYATHYLAGRQPAGKAAAEPSPKSEA